jgi:predicted RNA-binding protein (virulence factor B family)
MSNELQAGRYHTLVVDRIVSIGAYVQDGKEGILVPKRYLPETTQPGHELEVFLYHDSEDRLIATTLHPKAVVGQFAFLKVVSTSSHGAFLDWGLPKDLFVPRSQQIEPMKEGRQYMVYVYLDDKTGRVAATEYTHQFMKADTAGLQVKQPVRLLVHRQTPLGFSVIVDDAYEGLVHHADAVAGLAIGDRLHGFIKHIREDGKLDVVPGKAGYEKISGEPERILALLRQHKGALPYNDKSDPADIYAFFGISKKAFKMAIGALYKQRLIEILPGGIKLLGDAEG